MEPPPELSGLSKGRRGAGFAYATSQKIKEKIHHSYHAFTACFGVRSLGFHHELSGLCAFYSYF